MIFFYKKLSYSTHTFDRIGNEFSLKALNSTMVKGVRLALKQASELAGYHPFILQLQKNNKSVYIEYLEVPSCFVHELH